MVFKGGHNLQAWSSNSIISFPDFMHLRALLIPLVLLLSISRESEVTSNAVRHNSASIDMVNAVERILMNNCKKGPTVAPSPDQRTSFDVPADTVLLLNWIGLQPLMDRFGYFPDVVSLFCTVCA